MDHTFCYCLVHVSERLFATVWSKCRGIDLLHLQTQASDDPCPIGEVNSQILQGIVGPVLEITSDITYCHAIPQTFCYILIHMSGN